MRAIPFLFLILLLASGSSDKKVLTYFYTDWCGACVTFKNDTKKDKNIQLLLESVAFIEINSSHGAGKEGARKRKIYAYPSFILSDSRGNPINQWFGYSKTSFKKMLKDAIEDPFTVDDKVKLQAENPSSSRAVFLAKYFQTKQEFRKAVEYFEQASNLDKNPCAYLEQKFEISKLQFLFSSRSPDSFSKMEEILLSAMDCHHISSLAFQLADLALGSQLIEKHQEWATIGHQMENQNQPEMKK